MEISPIARQAGSAVIWKAVQLISTKIIFLARTLILAAVLFPEDFGLFSISVVALDFLSSLTNLGLSQALVQKEVQSKKTLDTVWTIGVLRGLILTAVLFLSAEFVAGLFNESRVAGILKILAIKPILDELSSIKVAYLIKELNFKAIAKIKIAESLVSALTAIIFASAIGVWALILGIIAGSFIYLICSYIYAPHKPAFSFSINHTKPLITFGIWIFLISFTAVISGTWVQVVISRNLGTTALGLYYLASKLAFMAVEISSEVVGSVAFSVYSRVQMNFEKVSAAWNILIKSLAMIYFPLVFLLIGTAPYLVKYILGAKWTGTVILIQYLAAAGIFGIFGDAAVSVLKGLGKPGKIFFVELIQSFLLVISVYFLCNYMGIQGAGIAWIIAGIASFISNVFILRRIQIRPLKENKIFLTVICGSSAVGTLISLLILKLFPGILGFISAIIAGIIAIISLFWIFNVKLRLGISEMINKIFPNLIPNSLLIRTNL